MAIATQTLPLPYGATLVFHFDDAYPQSEQVGTLDYYQAVINQLVYQSLEYYTQGAVNLFLRHVTLHIYADFIPYTDPPSGTDALTGGFWTYNDGAGHSHINAHWLDTSQVANSYRFPASLSHEFGHAYSFWCGWPGDATWGAEVARFWSNEVVGGQSYPSGWNLYEAFANAYRCLKGVATTRGISGTANGGSDPVPAPMQDPVNHPEWLKQFNLLPETCAFMQSYGCQAGSLSWQTGAGGYWQFKRSDGVWVAQTNYDQWFEWNGAWVQYSPTYSRT